MARRARRKPTQEEQVAEHRQRCRGPEWWAKYTDQELAAMQAKGKRLREEGYASDEVFCDWLELWGNK